MAIFNQKKRNGVARLESAVGQFQAIVNELETAATEINGEIDGNADRIGALQQQIESLTVKNTSLASEADRACRTAYKIRGLLQ